MFFLLMLSQVAITSPPRTPATAHCRMSVASCERLRQLNEEDTEYIGEGNVVAQDYEPMFFYELQKLKATEPWGSYPTEGFHER